MEEQKPRFFSRVKETGSGTIGTEYKNRMKNVVLLLCYCKEIHTHTLVPSTHGHTQGWQQYIGLCVCVCLSTVQLCERYMNESISFFLSM